MPDPSVLLWKLSASCNTVGRLEVAGEDREIISLNAPTCLAPVACTAAQLCPLSPEAGMLTWQQL